MTDHDQNEAALTLAGMISASRPFAELHPSAAVPIAAQIVDAIRAGKVPGIYQHDSDTVSRYIASEEELRADLDKLRNMIAALRAERDEARKSSNIYHEAWSEAQSKLSGAESALAQAQQNIGHLEAERDDALGHYAHWFGQAKEIAEQRDAALERVKEANGMLLLIGERALVDFDNLTMGAIDAAVKEDPGCYREWLREVYGNAMDAPKLKADNERLRGAMAYAVNHAGGRVSDDCSTEFLCMGADQIKLYVERISRDNEQLRGLLDEARESVRKEIEENRENWGERLMHKQEPAIELLKRIDQELGQ